jgi:hypothetical protein
MWSGIVFVVLWNLIAVPVGIAVVHEAVPKGHQVPWLTLVFPLAGVAVAVSAVRRTLQYRRFGVSQLDLERVPIPVGHALVGTICAAIDALPPDSFRVVLACINRTTTSTGDDRPTSESIRWQEERRVPGTTVRDYRGPGVTIPIAFAIPADARGTDESTPRNVIVWRLSVSASLPGVEHRRSTCPSTTRRRARDGGPAGGAVVDHRLARCR